MAQQHEVWAWRISVAWLSLLGLVGLGAALYFALWATLSIIGALVGILATIFAAAYVADGHPAKNAKKTQQQVRDEHDRSHIW